jgi:hypothetical protein
MYLFAFTLREVCLSESGHRPPDHKVTNYVISKICDVTQSEFARVPTRGPWVRGWCRLRLHDILILVLYIQVQFICLNRLMKYKNPMHILYTAMFTRHLRNIELYERSSGSYMTNICVIYAEWYSLVCTNMKYINSISPLIVKFWVRWVLKQGLKSIRRQRFERCIRSSDFLWILTITTLLISGNFIDTFETHARSLRAPYTLTYI